MAKPTYEGRLGFTAIDSADVSKWVYNGDDWVSYQDFSDILEHTQSGDDEGLIVHGQLSVGTWDNPDEFVGGGGDSTVETMVCLHETGTNLGVYTDVTETFATDTGSALPLLPGTAINDAIYVGADFEYSGTKFKIATDGLIESDNIHAEFWDGTAWVEVKYMSCDAGGILDQFGDELAQNGVGNEQVRFNFDPYNQKGTWQKSTINGELKYWSRLHVIAPITSSPILEQIKLHTNRTEINATGLIEFFGIARYPATLVSGMQNKVKNSLYTPANEPIQYTPTITAAHESNEFSNTALDGFLYEYQIDAGVDTSIPIKVYVSFYGKGVIDGDVQTGLEIVRVGPDFTFDGTAASETQYEIVPLLGADTLKRQIGFNYVDISKYKVDDTLLLNVFRDGTDVLDTYNANIVVENVIITGYKWRL